jgi:hypothetical protein
MVTAAKERNRRSRWRRSTRWRTGVTTLRHNGSGRLTTSSTARTSRRFYRWFWDEMHRQYVVAAQ